MHQFVYPATLTPDSQDGGFVVTFIDVPEAITQGDSVQEALQQAADCLDEALVGRIRRREVIPAPSPVEAGQYAVAVPAHTAAKAALYLALRQAQVTQGELAARLQCDEKAVRRLLDPRHASRLSRMEAALAVFGQQFVVSVQPVSGTAVNDVHEAAPSPAGLPPVSGAKLRRKRQERASQGTNP